MSSRDSAYFSAQNRRSSSTDEILKMKKDDHVESGDLLRNLLKEREKSWQKGIYPSNGVWHVNEVTIDSNFDSGNLANVEFNTQPISDEDAIDRRQEIRIESFIILTGRRAKKVFTFLFLIFLQVEISFGRNFWSTGKPVQSTPRSTIFILL